MTPRERLLHRKARRLSGLARLEHEAPRILYGSREVPAWLVPGHPAAVAWVMARARYARTLARLRVLEGLPN